MGGTHGVSLPHRGSPPGAAATGPAAAAIGWLPGTPEPSRRPVASGRSTGAPLEAAARAGAAPAQAKTRASSPLRKRWQRTPPVARPLGGYSVNGVTFTAPGSVPGSAVEEPEAVTTTASAASTAPNHATCSPSVTRTPAMPPPERPCGRTPSAPKCSSCASEVMKHSVSSPVARSSAPTTSSPSLSEMTSHSSRDSTSGFTRLTTPWRVPSASPGPEDGSAGERQRAFAGVQREHLRERHAALQVGVVGRRGDGGQVEHAQLEHPAPRGDDADLAARGGADGRHHHVVVGAGAAGARGLVRGRTGQQAARGEEREARVVGDLEGDRGGGDGRARRLEQDRAPRGAVGLRDLGQLVRDHLAEQGLVAEDRVEVLDDPLQLGLLLLQLDAGELREAAQRHLEDVVGLGLGEVEDLHQPLAGHRRVVAGADQLDDLVDVEDRGDQAVDEVQPVGGLGAAEHRAASYDVEAVPEEDLEELLEPERAGLPVDQRDGVDAERVLHRRLPVELLEQRLGVEAVLDLDDEAQALLAVGEVLDVRDALDLLALDERLDPLDDLLGADAVGQLGHHDALAARRHRLDPGGGPHPERAAAGQVGVADALEPDDLAAGGQVRAGDEAHQPVDVGLRVVDEVPERLDDLDQVVRRDVRGHADRDAGGAVHDQVGDRRRQHGRLGLAAVVVGLEVDGVLVDRGGHRDGGRGHPGLGVAHGRGGVVGRAEVAVAVDERDAHRPRLRHAHHRVVDRGVAVRVQATHDLTDDAGALDVTAVGPQAHVVHRVQDPALHRLEPVPGVGQGPGVDDRVGVLEEGRAHLVPDVDVEDVLLEVVGEVLLRLPCHAAHSPRSPPRNPAGTPQLPDHARFRG